jgi:hypothetical protein
MQQDVIQQLVHDLQPRESLVLIEPMRAMLFIGLLLCILVLVFLGLRADFGHMPSIIKPGIFMIIAGCAVGVGFYSAMPSQSTKRATLPLATFIALCGTFILANVIIGGVPEIQQGLQLPNRVFCPSTIAVLGFIPMTILLIWFRRTAPINPALTGSYIGLASGALAAATYALHCNVDNVFYVSVWYVLPILVHTIIGRFLGTRFLRW